MNNPSLDLDVYLKERILRLESLLVRARAADSRFVWIRLWVLLAGAAGVAGVYLLGAGRFTWLAGLLYLMVFLLVVLAHRRVLGLMDRENAVLELAKAQLARARLDWSRVPAPVFPLGEDTTPLERDLDLVGEHSLHRLLDLSVSRGGSRRLRSWLGAGLAADLPERQAQVKEMLPLTGFRERIALAGALVFGPRADRFDGQSLLDWLERRIAPASLRRPLILLSSLSVVNVTLFILSALGLLPPFWIGGLVLYGGIYFYVYGSFKDLFSQAVHLQNRLGQFKAVAGFLESYPYATGGPLDRLCAPFTGPLDRPSHYLRGIARVTSAAGLQNNGYLWLTLNILIPWDLYFAYRLEQYKLAIRDRLPRWLDTWYELEALHALANFAFLNPGYAFPQVDPAGEGPAAVFSAERLGHPLIPLETRVNNDFSIARLGDLALITGSNMSGKSTFLRTLGTNLCLAYAGAPVAARSLCTRQFSLYTCIQVTDSLADGISYFYAEVRRLKGLLDALAQNHTAPVFYLIDEIFRGTNNRERETGGRAFVRALTGSRGVGLISTHDLELAHLSQNTPNVSNYHFRERVTQDHLVFEYHLRPGPSQTTNALLIMKMEGLPVE